MNHSINYIVLLLITALCASCENPYENISGADIYSGKPFVMLSSEESSVRLGVNSSNNSSEPGLFVDSLILSHKLDYDLHVTLEKYEKNTTGELDDNFRFQHEVIIEKGKNVGYFEVEALNMDASNAQGFELAVRIKSTDSDAVIAGLNGMKAENGEREKRFKIFKFR